VKIYNRYLDKDEIRQRDRLINEIEIKGYEQVIEEVAYTWFNRFVALRFMEVNGYLPSGVRVLSSENAGKAEPDIVTEVLNIDLDIDTETVYQYQDDNDTNGLFKYILIKQCNSLNDIMPFIFEKIDDYTEILLPNNLLSEGSVIRDMVESISEGDWREKVEIIGWLYQYYNSEKKDEVFASKKKIKKDEIPAATQLFTNDWIVKYMVENTLGRMWIESNPDSQLINKWDYYIKESEQEAEVIKKLKLMSMSNVNPRDIKILDPSCGSGHILVYAFDVLYDIYEKSGFMKNDIPLLILKNNLFGLDIDDRAAQLAYFSLLMKARGFDKEIFTKDIKVNVSSIIESNDIDKNIILNLIDEVSGLKKKEELKKEIIKLIDYFKDAKYYGSLITVHNIGLDIIKDFLDKIKGYNFSLFDIQYIKILREKLPKLIKQSRIISQKYNVVITNPPYMGNRYMNKKLKNFLKEQYNAYNKDLFSVFIKRCFEFADNNGYISMITMESWMFLKSFDSLRREIINDKTIINLIHMPYEGKGRTSLGINFGTTAFTVRNIKIENYSTNFSYIRHTDIDEEGVPSIFPVINNRYGYKKVDMFTDIPSFPLAYWADESTIKAYENGKLLGDIAEARLGMATANNNRFIRSWFEIDINKLGLGFKSRNQAKNNDYKWFPYNKGGNFRKWYGNNEYVVNWENDGYEIRNFKDKNGRVRSHNYNLDYIFKQSITWTFISSAKFGVRYSPQGFIFDVGGSSVFPSESDIFYITAFMCSKLSFKFLKIQNPTLNFQVVNISDLPIIKPNSNSLLEKINNLTKTNIELSKNDWDSFETSWNFKEHPLLANKRDAHTIQEAFDNWSDFADKQFYQLKENEEE
ncbi:MAG: BREX-1 system adenine-specific DNA-methyltransferase PglX, partial [bacterium]